MPTKPLETVLYRELSQVAVNDIIGVTSPLLQEVVNYSTNVFARCLGASVSKGHEDTSILTLYRHVIEMTDSIEILVSRSCPNPPAAARSSSHAVAGVPPSHFFSYFGIVSSV